MSISGMKPLPRWFLYLRLRQSRLWLPGPDCDGCCCDDKGCGENHNWTLLDSVDPTCLTLGYDRYLCVDCGMIEKRDYEAALGHAYQSVAIRDAPVKSPARPLIFVSGAAM